MFKMYCNSPCQIQGTLKLKRDPFWYGMGYYEDEDGVKWDIVGVIGGVIGGKGEPYVQARRVDNHSTYYGTGTNDNCYGSHTWLPYKVELVMEKENG